MDATGLGLRFGAPIPLRRCPYCGVARPQMLPTWLSAFTEGVNGFPGRIWGAFRCTSCGQIVLAGGHGGHNPQQASIERIHPRFLNAAEELPEPARENPPPAVETLHPPDRPPVLAVEAVNCPAEGQRPSEQDLC